VRRTCLAATAFLTCALPLVFTVNITRMLVTGVESDHQFHQATGQGLVLFVLWLGALVPLIRAGWRGDRPSVAAGYRHLAFVVVGAVCAALAPGGGAPIAGEVWRMSPGALGRFLAELPAPMSLGQVELSDGTSVVGFGCTAETGAQGVDITASGGWLAAVASGL